MYAIWNKMVCGQVGLDWLATFWSGYVWRLKCSN